MCIVRMIGGAFRRRPEEMKDRLSTQAADLLKRCFEEIDPERLVDFHTHIAGTGSGGTNTFVNPRMLSWTHPFHRIKFAVYMSACDVISKEQPDAQLIHRLVTLVENIPSHGKHRLLAFDKNYTRDGNVNLSKTEFYVPNEYVFDLSAQYPDLFLPTISVNPYRSDSLVELERCSVRGGRIVKWLPNAMGINPSDPKCDPFYEKMKQLRLVLLSHGGEEKAVEAEEDQKLGNPLLLRRPLDHGVKVIVAHCAGLGSNEDLDSSRKERRSNFELFLRLMREKKYEGLVYGEISAMTQYNRLGLPLITMLEREDLHSRLVNGSDYPLPAINILIRTKSLVNAGYLDADLRPLVNEIYDFNPLLFDFVLKRCIASPHNRKRFPPSVFMSNPHLGL